MYGQLVYTQSMIPAMNLDRYILPHQLLLMVDGRRLWKGCKTIYAGRTYLHEIGAILKNEKPTS